NPGDVLPGTINRVNPEHITDFEAGFKSDLFDQRMRLNLTAFHYDYKDMQVLQFNGSSSLLRNAASATIQGLELESVAIITDRLTARGNISFLDATYDKFENVREPGTVNPDGTTANVVLANAAGNHLTRSPEWTATLGFDYTIPMPDSGSVVLGVNGYYNDGFFWDNVNRLQEDAYTIFNASVLWNLPGDRYSIRLWSNNLGETEYCNYRSGVATRLDNCVPAAPRTYGVTFNAQF
ncbi:MAG: TonB-dependent receptor, partial [Hyphomonadaceae bacterium]